MIFPCCLDREKRRARVSGGCVAGGQEVMARSTEETRRLWVHIVACMQFIMTVMDGELYTAQRNLINYDIVIEMSGSDQHPI